MSRSQKLRVFVTQRLNAVAEEILAAFEDAILKYEEEAVLSQQVISRQHALLCALNKSMMEAPAADVFTQQLLVPKEDRNDQNEVLQPSHDEEKREEQPEALDEADIIQFTYNSRPPLKIFKGFQPLADPRSASPDLHVAVVLSSETEDSDDYCKDAAEARAASHKPLGLHAPNDGFSCQACSRAFSARRFLFRHVTAHVHDPKPVCGLCGEQFEASDGLKLHLQTHTRKKVQQNQRRTWSRERRLQQLPGVQQSVAAQESRKPENPGRTFLKKRRRGRPPSNKERPNNQKEIKKKKRTV